MRKYIIITGGFQLPDKNASAVRALGLARCIKSIGYEPIVCGVIDKNTKVGSIIKFHGINCFNLKDVKTISTNIDYIQELTKVYSNDNIYAIIAYNYAGVALYKLYKYTKQHNIKMVSDITEWYAFGWPGQSLKGAIVRKLQTELRMRFLNSKIGNIICSTNYISKYYDKQHTLVLPMIDDQSFNGPRHFQPIENQTPRRFFYAGSPGYRFQKDKINQAITLFEKLSNENIPYRFDIYGVSLDDYVRFFPVPKAKPEEIQFHGRVPRETIIEKLSKVDYYVLLRPNDKVCKVGFSTKSMESISSGVPLIANDVNGDFALYFNKGQALLCDAEDMSGFYYLLKQACQMSDVQLTEMKEACRAENPFIYERFLIPLKTFLEELK